MGKDLGCLPSPAPTNDENRYSRSHRYHKEIQQAVHAASRAICVFFAISGNSYCVCMLTDSALSIRDDQPDCVFPLAWA